MWFEDPNGGPEGATVGEGAWHPSTVRHLGSGLCQLGTFCPGNLAFTVLSLFPEARPMHVMLCVQGWTSVWW